jgi:hypothetical protein
MTPMIELLSAAMAGGVAAVPVVWWRARRRPAPAPVEPASPQADDASQAPPVSPAVLEPTPLPTHEPTAAPEVAPPVPPAAVPVDASTVVTPGPGVALPVVDDGMRQATLFLAPHHAGSGEAMAQFWAAAWGAVVLGKDKVRVALAELGVHGIRADLIYRTLMDSAARVIDAAPATHPDAVADLRALSGEPDAPRASLPATPGAAPVGVASEPAPSPTVLDAARQELAEAAMAAMRAGGAVAS